MPICSISSSLFMCIKTPQAPPSTAPQLAVKTMNSVFSLSLSSSLSLTGLYCVWDKTAITKDWFKSVGKTDEYVNEESNLQINQWWKQPLSAALISKHTVCFPTSVGVTSTFAKFYVKLQTRCDICKPNCKQQKDINTTDVSISLQTFGFSLILT